MIRFTKKIVMSTNGIENETSAEIETDDNPTVEGIKNIINTLDEMLASEQDEKKDD